MEIGVFSEWLKEQLKEKDITQADLARRSGISPSQVSKIINDQSPPGKASLIAIAESLQLPKDLVFRKAGILPPVEDRTDAIDQILHELGGVPLNGLDDITDYIRLYKRTAERRAKYTPRSEQ